MHSVGNAETLSQHPVGCAVCEAVMVLTELLNVFVLFSGHLPSLKVKQTLWYDFNGQQ